MRFDTATIVPSYNMAASFLILTILGFQLLLISPASSQLLEVCGDADVALDECSNCCMLKAGCIYLERGTGSPVCLAANSSARPCPRNCEGPRIKVCPSNPFTGFGRIPISVLPPDKAPSTGCTAYDLSTAAPVDVKEESCLENAVEICGGTVHPWKENTCVTCCTIPQGCMDLGQGGSICLSGPSDACTRECGSVSYVCPGSTPVSLDFNSCHTCEKPLKEGCKLYNRQGHELCVEEDNVLQLA